MENDSSPSGKTKKHGISWLRLTIAIVALILIGGSLVYFNRKVNKTSASSSSSSSSTSARKPYYILANDNLPMIVTVNTRAQGDKTGSIAVLHSDGKGNYRYELFANGKPFNTTIYTPDAFYACKDFSSPCLKYPKDTKSGDFQPSNFLYSATIVNKIKALKSTTYQGQQPCPVGGDTCDVWTYGNKMSMKTDYVNMSSKKLVAVIDAGHFGNTAITTKMTYQYVNQAITTPANYKDAPADSQ
jgi:hypothetical protein